MPLPPKYPLITLMQLEAKHIAEINKILTMAVNRLEADIKALGKAGGNPITLMQSKATKASLESFLGQTFDSMEGAMRAGILDAAAAASGVVSAYEAQLLGMVMSPEAMANLAKAEAQRAAMGIEAALQRIQGQSYVPLSKTVYNTKQMTLGWVDKRINQGLASGWSHQQLAAELKKMIDPNVKGGVSYAANRTARTEINNAFHASSAERYATSPVVLEVDWHLSSSHPEGDICDSLVSDGPYPKNSVPMKPHPHCYCYITPALPEPAKFVDNLFKGKYGSPPPPPPLASVAKLPKVPLPPAPGSKAANTASQQAMHNAIKKDPVPTKKTLANQLNMTDPAEYKGILKASDFQKVVNGMSSEEKAWFASNAGKAQKKFVMSAHSIDGPTPEDVLKYIKSPAGANTAKNEAAAVAGKDYSILVKQGWMSSDEMAAIRGTGVDPDEVVAFLKKLSMEQVEFMDDIIGSYNSPTFLASFKSALKVNPNSNTALGDLKSLAEGALPKKVWTQANISEWSGLSKEVLEDLAKAQKMTPDQVVGQLGKFSADELAAIKKLHPQDQAYYIKMGTTPTHDAYLKPVAPPGSPTMASMAKEFDIPEQWLEVSGASPEQMMAFLKGLPGGSKGQLDNLKGMNASWKKQEFLAEAKNVDLGHFSAEAMDAWKVKWGFADDIKAKPVPKTSYVDLESKFGMSSDVWAESGLSPDDCLAAVNNIKLDPAAFKKFYQHANGNDFDDFLDMLKAGAKGPNKPPPIQPSTLPAPKVPSLPDPPKPSVDLYNDVSEMYPKGDWKPNLLQKTGATPQQIADYVEDMSQAQYEHFMNLKWPSQKKHFEKLATKTDNASTYEASVKFAQSQSQLPKPGIPRTSDPELLAKWKGKTQPPKPIEPKAPIGAGPAAYDDFLKESKEKFAEFAAKTGNAKNDLTKSNNWSYFQKVVNDNDMASLDYLLKEKYIDGQMYGRAKVAMQKAVTPDPADAAKFKKGMEEFADSKLKFDKDITDWRDANGITSQSKGTWDGALSHKTNDAGVKWANDNLPTAKGDSRSAITRYSGSSYQDWNSALRKNANGDTVPSGKWAGYTADADRGMFPSPEDVVVRRGTGWNEFVTDSGRMTNIPPPPPSDLIGSVQTQHGYTSTSVGDSSAFSGRISMNIRVPQGHPVSWVDPYSAHKGERELLISRSSNYYIHDVYQKNGKWIVDAEIVPFGEDASSWSPIASAMRA